MKYKKFIFLMRNIEQKLKIFNIYIKKKYLINFIVYDEK